MIHHRCFSFNEIRRCCCPRNNSRRHRAVLRQGFPELKSLCGSFVIVINFRTGIVHQVKTTLLIAEGLQHPVSIAVRRNFNAILRTVRFCQLLRILLQLIPCGRCFLRIQSCFLKRFFIVVKHNGTSLPRNTVGSLSVTAVHHESIVETVQPFFVCIRRTEAVDICNRIHCQQGIQIDRKHDCHIRCIACLDRSLYLCTGVRITSGIYRFDRNIRIFFMILRAQRINQSIRTAANCYREIHGQFHRIRAGCSCTFCSIRCLICSVFLVCCTLILYSGLICSCILSAGRKGKCHNTCQNKADKFFHLFLLCCVFIN